MITAHGATAEHRFDQKIVTSKLIEDARRMSFALTSTPCAQAVTLARPQERLPGLLRHREFAVADQE
ncbi:MAG TPA: hypothetical protein VH877_07195 [Polyangia bacterium]|nr:hypothetical protein [Polyangia bacterium]